jgi:serine/threonine protein kinase
MNSLQSLDVALGLEYLHGENIIHGDLKGVRLRLSLASWITCVTMLIQVNILVSPSRRACLSDFGLATARDSKPTVRTYMSTSRATGTLRWQAPELLLDTDTDSRTTFATDVYAFAMVCYEVSRFTFRLRNPLYPDSRCFLGHIPFTILRMILRSFWQYNRAKGRPHHHTT